MVKLSLALLRRPVVCPGHDGAAERAGVHARAAPPHGPARAVRATRHAAS
uniref:Uncharacterized protein n=1 Tax=Arundo donax TaxID=35708 RepID=A0A0A9BUK1_ARUDO